ncbi:Os11g0666300, partial [Oryza sativa Japonica Group]
QVFVDVVRKVASHGKGGEVFTLVELAAATNNFAADREIGYGSFGTVYKGTFPDGRKVAIKHEGADSVQGHRDAFLSEVDILPTLRHRHIIRLLGWCVAEKENSLVYEYMKNGSLHDHLHGGAPSSSSPSPVTTSWRKHMEILLGISRAIEYLHSHAVTPVIHRDDKASNILLDDTWAPRLADFGLSLKISWDDIKCRNAPVMGTSRYADPEYISTGRLTLAMDVYSFGVVMLEMLTGKTAAGLVSNNKNSLVSFALPKIEAKKLEEVLDRRPAQKPTARQLQATDLVAATAARCLCLQGKKRPAISEVVAELTLVEKPSFVGRPISTIVPDTIKTGAKDDL